MKHLLSIGSLAALTAVSASAADPSARDAFAAGLRDFAASNFSAAADGFLEAAAAAPAAKLDPAAALFNAGLAAYADGNFEAAADSFARASAGSNLRLQSQAFYNRGNALFQQVGANSAPLPALPLPNASSQQLAAAAASVGDAIQMYENAIALDDGGLAGVEGGGGVAAGEGLGLQGAVGEMEEGVASVVVGPGLQAEIGGGGRGVKMDGGGFEIAGGKGRESRVVAGSGGIQFFGGRGGGGLDEGFGGGGKIARGKGLQARLERGARGGRVRPDREAIQG